MFDIIIDNINKQATTIGKHKFQEIPPNHHFQPFHSLIAIETMLLLELRQQVVGSLNRSSYQLRKE